MTERKLVDPSYSASEIVTSDRQNNFKAASFALIFLSVFAFFFHYVLWGTYLHVGSPLPYLGELPTIVANDLTRLMTLSSSFSPYQNIREIFPYEAVPYPPASFVIHGLLAQVGGSGAALIFYSLFITCYCYLLWLDSAVLSPWDRRITCLAFTFGIYPFYYVLDRANFDGLAVVLLWSSLRLYDKQSQGRHWLPAFLIAVAGSLKIYPMFFAIIFLRRRHIQAFLFCSVAFIALTLFAGLALHGNLHDQVQGFISELQLTNNCFQSYDSCLNLSFAYPLKMILHTLLGVTSSLWVFKTAYTISVLLLLAFVLSVILFLKPEYPIAVSLLALVSIWIPVMSFDYKLLLLVPPVLMLLKDSRPSFLLLSLFMGSALIAKRALGTAGEAGLNQIILCVSFALSLLLSHPLGITFVDFYARRINKTVFIAILVTFCLMYVGLTARSFWVPGLFGDVHIAMSHKDPRGTYGFGWGAFEGNDKSTWRWTDGCEGEIHLKLQPISAYQLKAVVQTHLANHHQIVSTYYNGTKIGEAELTADKVKELTFDIPKELVSKEAILPDRLIFRTSSCNPPSSNSSVPLGISVSHINVVIAK